MRGPTLSLAICAWLLAAPALAAPTCQDRGGDTVKCGTEGAMPVGWSPSPQELWRRQISRPADQNSQELLKVIIALGLFFAFIALLPEFDGRQAADWDKREEDGE